MSQLSKSMKVLAQHSEVSLTQTLQALWSQSALTTSGAPNHALEIHLSSVFSAEQARLSQLPAQYGNQLTHHSKLTLLPTPPFQKPPWPSRVSDLHQLQPTLKSSLAQITRSAPVSDITPRQHSKPRLLLIQPI